jgi:hypothetical protein
MYSTTMTSSSADIDGLLDDLRARRGEEQDKRRRLATIVAVAVVAARRGRRGPYSRAPSGTYHRLCWGGRVNALTSRGFLQRYKLTKGLFATVAGTISRHLKVAGGKAAASCPPIPVELQLSATLRFFAGGHIFDICDLHGFSISSFYRILRGPDDAPAGSPIGGVTGAIIAVLNFPDMADWDVMSAVERGYADITRGAIRGFVGSLDGLQIRIRKPRSREAPNPAIYANRKKFYAINVQAICDSTRRFLWFSASSAGGTHDSRAFQNTALYGRLVDGTAFPWTRYFIYYYFLIQVRTHPIYQSTRRSDFSPMIAADEAYGQSAVIMTPFSGKDLAPDRDNYNFLQSRVRIEIECAFGMLVGRFGCFWKKLLVRHDRAAAILEACMLLHNLCLVHRVDSVRLHGPDCPSHRPDGIPDPTHETPLAPSGPGCHFTSGSSLVNGEHAALSISPHAHRQGRVRARDEPTRLRLVEEVASFGIARPLRSTYSRRRQALAWSDGAST